MPRNGSARKTLAQWLNYIEHDHSKLIDLGLERISQIKNYLKLNPVFPLIIVGGTNGKGSVCAMLERILTDAGYRVGCYTSPHLLHYNERIRINLHETKDDDICDAFQRIDLTSRNSGISLTYFEYGTLAAMLLFIQSKVDIAILEVGLGGRLDAVNIFDADCAILTNIGLDHMNHLGETREKIGLEKAHIFRSGKPAICADVKAPITVKRHAEKIGAHYLQIENDFGYVTKQNSWYFWDKNKRSNRLPYPALQGLMQLKNASACLAALRAIDSSFSVKDDDIHQGLQNVSLPGRLQVISYQPLVILDVAHNLDSAQALAESLDTAQPDQHTYAVFAMLCDKDIAGVINALKHCVDTWLISALHVPRGAHATTLLDILLQAGVSTSDHSIRIFSDPVNAFGYACKHAANNDRICVTGSFYTVSAILQDQNATWSQLQNRVLLND